MCGADLSGAADLGVRYSHQVTDLPEARAETVQHDRHEVRCASGQVHVADAPAEAAGAPVTVTYGLNFQAWCVFLLVMHHIPVERCADIIESMSGTRPSDGWVHSLLERAAQAVAEANMAIRALILLARVVCGDETPVRVGPGPKSRKMLLECLRHREADVLRFLTAHRHPAHLQPGRTRPAALENPAEDQRPAARSEKTTRDRYAIRGYASTAAKHGIAVFTAIRDALAGNPWIPPVPATN